MQLSLCGDDISIKFYSRNFIYTIKMERHYDLKSQGHDCG